MQSDTSVTPILRINSERLKSDFDRLAEIGATMGGGVSRTALSNEDLEARAWLAGQIEDAGLLLNDDPVGNISGILPSRRRGARTLLIGSHLDTVQNGGLYDGSIGVLAGLEVLRTIKEAGLELPVHLEVIDFTDEEGWWHSFFGSMGLVGLLEASHINDSRQDNAAFRAALFRAGIRPDEVYKAKRDREKLYAFLELHIEQGERLARSGIDVGLVTAIVGRVTYQFTFYGEATHAGTTEYDKRRDALLGASVFITRMHQLAHDEFIQGAVNCGNISVKPGTFNVVPAEASLRVEFRHPDKGKLDQMEAAIIALAQDSALQHHLTLRYEAVIRRPVATLSPTILRTLEEVGQELGYSSMRMVSYPGHDAQILNMVTPSAMIFVPSVNGISHNPREFTEWRSIEAGANMLLHTVLKLVEQYPVSIQSP